MKNKIDLVVSFDTTGSMYPVLSQVRREVEQFVKAMFEEFLDLRLGIIAHGDYCDAGDPYTIRAMELTRDEKELCKFVHETKSTYGGDADECYELVLHTAHNDLKWRKDADKILIMIGDASPHAPSYSMNEMNLDWKEEADTLRKQGIKVFSVHALARYRSSSKAFYKYVADTTGGIYLTLDMFNEIVDLIKATCYQQGGEDKLNEFVTIIKDSGRLTRSMENNFKRLRGEEVEDTYEEYRRPSSRRASTASKDVTIKEMDKLVPVLPGRFQIMTVDENCAIKAFVEDNGIEFKTGRGFYELSKAETVQQYKEVIMMDKETGEMFNGSQVREELGLSPQSEKGGVKERIHKSAAEKYRVFIQSTSVNRKLIAGTTFLYEIADLEDSGTVIEVEESKPVEKKTTSKTKTVKEEKKAETKTVEKKATKKKSEKKTAKAEVVETKTAKSEVFSDKAVDKVSKVFEDIDIDTSKTKVKKAADKKTSKGFKPEKLAKQISVVNTAIERYNSSTNKKNTEFIKNNLNKLIKEAQALLDSIE